MKKFIALLISITMILTMAVPVFADDAYASAKPAKVQNVKVLKNGYNSLKITWDKIDGAEKYQVYRSTTGKSGSFVLKRTVTGTTYSNTGITCGKTYYYKVRAVNSKGKGLFSAVKSNKVQPSTPKLSVPLGGEGPYDYTPKPTWNKVSGATGYDVYRTIEGKNNWKKVISTTKTYFLDGRNYGWSSFKNYEYKVRAYRKVNGKKVYSYFSIVNKYVPNWDMDEIIEELAAYGETIEGQRMMYDVELDEYVPYHGKFGETYTMPHVIGYIEDSSSYTGYREVKLGDKASMKDPTFEEITPENSSWTARWPEYISPYEKKSDIIKQLKKGVKWNIEVQMKANPLSWDSNDPETEEWWYGVEDFTLYARPEGNGYNFWVMF